MSLRPRIILKKKVLTSLIAPAGARNAAMIGTAIWGPVNTATTISTLSEYVSYFGDDKTGTGVTGIKGADLFFRNGGTLIFVRIVDGAEVKSTLMTLNGVTDVLKFDAKYYGTHGNNIYVTITANATTAANREVTITDGSSTEIYTNAGAGYTTNQAIEDDITANSSLVIATAEAGSESSNIVDATVKTQMTGGDDAEDDIAIADITTAMDDVILSSNYNFLIIPGWTTDADFATIVGKLDTRASSEKLYSRFISGIAKDETIATAVARTSASERLTVVAPNVIYTHRIDDTDTYLDGSYLGCAYAGKLCALDLEISGTHENVNVEDTSVLESSGKKYYTKAEQEQLLQGRIAPITIIGSSVQMVRGITRIADTTSVFFEEVVMDIVDYVTTSLETYLNSKIGKPNTTVNRRIISAELNARLTVFQSQGILEDYTASTVVEGASPDTMIVSLGVKPAYSTNFIELTLNIN